MLRHARKQRRSDDSELSLEGRGRRIGVWKENGIEKVGRSMATENAEEAWLGMTGKGGRRQLKIRNQNGCLCRQMRLIANIGIAELNVGRVIDKLNACLASRFTNKCEPFS